MEHGLVQENLRTDSHNVLMSLPTCLIHCILSDWADAVSVIRLDFAFGDHQEFHSPLLDIFKANEFYIKKVDLPENMDVCVGRSLMLNWLHLRQAKVVNLSVHESCCEIVLLAYLQSFGDVLRHLTLYIPAHMSSAALYCHNITTLSLCTGSKDVHKDFLQILHNNPRLETLQINSRYWELHEPFEQPPTMRHLKQLKLICVDDGFEKNLALLVKAAPNMQKLSISCNQSNYVNSDESMMDVARACPHLRTFSCRQVQIGFDDNSLKRFFSICNDITHLDLSRHAFLHDTVLINALSPLTCLQSLDLRGCSRLTDRTLQFLARRFHNTLQVLYLDYTVMSRRFYEREAPQRHYIAAGVASLRAQCTKLHTFHYILRTGIEKQLEPIAAFQLATIVQLCGKCEVVFPLILEHCHQMQIFIVYASLVTPEHLVTLAEHFPLLHTVVIRENKDYNGEIMMDYSAVKKARPKLLITEYCTALDFDVLHAPI